LQSLAKRFACSEHEADVFGCTDGMPEMRSALEGGLCGVDGSQRETTADAFTAAARATLI